MWLTLKKYVKPHNDLITSLIRILSSKLEVIHKNVSLSDDNEIASMVCQMIIHNTSSKERKNIAKRAIQ